MFSKTTSAHVTCLGMLLKRRSPGSLPSSGSNSRKHRSSNRVPYGPSTFREMNGAEETSPSGKGPGSVSFRIVNGQTNIGALESLEAKPTDRHLVIMRTTALLLMVARASKCTKFSSTPILSRNIRFRHSFSVPSLVSTKDGDGGAISARALAALRLFASGRASAKSEGPCQSTQRLFGWYVLPSSTRLPVST